MRTGKNSLMLDISHRSLGTTSITSNEYWVFLFELQFKEIGANPFVLKTVNTDENIGTEFDIEIDTLPDQCRMSIKSILLETEATGEHGIVKFAIVSYFQTASGFTWDISNPKVSVKNLRIDFGLDLSYGNSPLIILNVNEFHYDETTYHNWVDTLLTPTVPAVRIGVIAPNLETLERITPLINFAEEDINTWLESNQYVEHFEFIIENAEGQDAVHQEKVDYFDSIGVKFLIGGFWSSQAEASIDYINENDILVFSPSSSHPDLSIVNDNLFRLCQIDDLQGPALAKMVWSFGIDYVLILQRNDHWGDKVSNSFVREYRDLGGEVIYRIRYEPEPGIPNPYETVLETAEEVTKDYQHERVGIVFLGWHEITDIITDRLIDHQYLSNIPWFGNDVIANIDNDDLLYWVDSYYIGLVCTEAVPTVPNNWETLSDRYYAATGNDLTFHDANVYDICRIYARAVLLAKTVDPISVKSFIPDVASTYKGATGYCNLNSNGDRYPVDYGLFAIGEPEEIDEWYQCGIYDSASDDVRWFFDAGDFPYWYMGYDR
jgi:branched-chain amino acid transport system substrate-binding protein